MGFDDNCRWGTLCCFDISFRLEKGVCFCSLICLNVSLSSLWAWPHRWYRHFRVTEHCKRSIGPLLALQPQPSGTLPPPPAVFTNRSLMKIVDSCDSAIQGWLLSCFLCHLTMFTARARDARFSSSVKYVENSFRYSFHIPGSLIYYYCLFEFRHWRAHRLRTMKST